ncbi:hypothetical protein ACFE04_011338 [Oxalis oulophora]
MKVQLLLRVPDCFILGIAILTGYVQLLPLKYWRELVQQVIKALERLLPQPVEPQLVIIGKIIASSNKKDNQFNEQPVGNAMPACRPFSDINLRTVFSNVPQCHQPSRLYNAFHIFTNLDHLKGLVDNDGKSHDETFHEVFGKERSGKVRCGGRTLTPTLLKKNQEMATMTKMHAMEMTSIKEDMKKKLEERDRDMKRKLEETQKYFKSMLKSVLTQMNPSLDVDAIDAMMPLTSRDANSDFSSSTAMHIPNSEDNDDIHEGDDSDDDDDDDDDEIDEGDVDGDEMDHEGNDGALK